jgi:hypothetical protein
MEYHEHPNLETSGLKDMDEEYRRGYMEAKKGSNPTQADKFRYICKEGVVNNGGLR